MNKLNIMNVSIELKIMLYWQNNEHCLQIQLKIQNRKIYPKLTLIAMADDPNVMKVLIVCQLKNWSGIFFNKAIERW